MIEGKFLEPILGPYLPWLYVSSYWWTALGFAGNILFTSRFLVQWYISERKHQLVVPVTFWYLSFWGSVINLIYVLHLDSAPLIFGVAVLPLLYGRNLILLKRGGNLTSVERPEPKPEALLAAKV